ncbi:PilN domain-containing protein [candidate division WWE3 bacterium]|uniref:PilN domain-containing protein n=1 Tax=candidate division WWE3 bacterium TaxID=2053526 RepID=A0A955LK89_UNCKA|nr:PilN domain-containing protein [candidate division WWE3 bacterium]
MPQGINLLPQARRDKKHASLPLVVWFNNVGIYIIFVMYALVLGSFAFRWYEDRSLRNVITEITEKTQDVRDKQDVLDEFLKKQQQFNVLGETVDSLSPKKLYLQTFADTIPQPITLDQFTINPGTVDISAHSTDYQALNQWRRSLYATDLFNVVEITSIDRNAEADVPTIDFKMAIQIKS